jgi:ABC-type nickel/cobalt efflux system permease component RcnA
MGIWIETGVFILVLIFGIWQIQDVKRERRKRSQARSQEKKD